MRTDNGRSAVVRESPGASSASSHIFRNAPFDGIAATGAGENRSDTRPQTLDPAQLVQMALSLSQSRSREVSRTLQVPLPTPDRRRSPGGHASGRNVSGASNRASQFSANSSRSSERLAVNGEPAGNGGPATAATADLESCKTLYEFSPATLSRAEKARKYFELAREYRKLLQYLPPLKPESASLTTHAVDGSGSKIYKPHPPGQISGVNKSVNPPLGRSYNPLQVLRDRRVRAREKRPFPISPNAFQDLEKVQQWVAQIEGVAGHGTLRVDGGGASLPDFVDEVSNFTAGADRFPTHSRANTASTVITRSENYWTVEPTEMLADACWIEAGDNKYLTERSNGDLVFPSQPRSSMETPNISMELHRDRNDATDATDEGSESEGDDKHHRRRKLMRPIKPLDFRKRRLLNRSASVSSESSSGSGGQTRRGLRTGDINDNTGPLKRHMNKLIAQDKADFVASPDQWEAFHDSFGRTNFHPAPEQLATDRKSAGNGKTPSKGPPMEHKRPKSVDSRERLDQVHSTFSAVRLAPTQTPPNGPASSPVLETDVLPDSYHTRTRPRLPVFQTQSRERKGVERTDFAMATPLDNLNATKNAFSTGSRSSTGPRPSVDSVRPAPHRHRTKDSFDSDGVRGGEGAYRGIVPGSSSTVGRLFKGGKDRIGGLIPERFRTREKSDSPPSEPDTVPFTREDDDASPPPMQPKRTEFEPVSARVSFEVDRDTSRVKSKYMTGNLPSFMPSVRDPHLQDLVGRKSFSSDVVNRRDVIQQDAGQEGDSAHLATPSVSQESGPGVVFWATPQQRERTYGDLQSHGPSGIRGDDGKTALGVPSPSSPSAPVRERQWSIYDHSRPQHALHVSPRDVARVRALVLASGIKAREIRHRAETSMSKPSALLLSVAQSSGTEPPNPLPTFQDEELVAANLISDHTGAMLSHLAREIESFQSETLQGLQQHTRALHFRAAEQLLQTVHNTSDEADATTVELTTVCPQNTKQVDDAVDRSYRGRKRQLRLLMNVAFKALELTLVGAMWSIWVVVVIVNWARWGICLVGRALRWLFSF